MFVETIKDIRQFHCADNEMKTYLDQLASSTNKDQNNQVPAGSVINYGVVNQGINHIGSIQVGAAGPSRSKERDAIDELFNPLPVPNDRDKGKRKLDDTASGDIDARAPPCTASQFRKEVYALGVS
ncbi:hypothetical protein MBANPS3_011891 [Mucor bainieri]